jgi:hypothetical protein
VEINVDIRLARLWSRWGQPMSATLEIEADATLENEATGCVVSSLSCLGF